MAKFLAGQVAWIELEVDDEMKLLPLLVSTF